MREECRRMEDLLVASTLHSLPPEDQAHLDKHLQNCPDCRRYLLVLQEDDRRLTAYVESTDEVMLRLEGRWMNDFTSHAPTQPSVRRMGWIQQGWFRIAAVAAAVTIVALALYLFDGDSGTGVAWAQVIERVVDAQDYICRIEKSASISPDMEMVQYCSGEYGLRQDLYVDDKNVAAIYLNPNSSQLITLVHKERKYVTMQLTDDDKEKMLKGSSAQEFIQLFRGEEYTDLGRKMIDDLQVQGIETTALDAWDSFFEEIRVRLWVDVRNQWPVKLEFDGKADGGKTWVKQVMTDFQWNPSLSAEDFACEVPPGYESVGNMPSAEANETSAIEGLRTYARLMQGEYPEKLVFTSALAQFEKEEPRLRREGQFKDADVMDILGILTSCTFYAELEQTGSDPVYYGDHVGPADFDAVLLRWGLGDGRYRVVFGDLRTEIVSRERLAGLERRD